MFGTLGLALFKLLPRGYRGPEPASEARTVDGNGDEGDEGDGDDDANDDLELWEEER